MTQEKSKLQASTPKTKTPKQLEEDYRALKALVASQGWKVLGSYLQADVLDAAVQMSQPQSISSEDLHFRRGAMWAAARLLRAPEELIFKIENETSIAKLNQTSKSNTQPAKAGKD